MGDSREWTPLEREGLLGLKPSVTLPRLGLLKQEEDR
jgi:hypothetical protein